MNIFSLLFSKTKICFPFPNLPLINQLKKISNSHDFIIFKNLTLYHRDKNIFIPMLILDTLHGIYLFEHKEWPFSYLQTATIDTSVNEYSQTNNLYFSKINTFIKQKLKEVTNNNEIQVSNFLLMENLTSSEYAKLPIDITELLPKNRLIFNDSTEKETLQKLQHTPLLKQNDTEIKSFMASLLSQYLILNHTGNYLATQEQRKFIDSPIRTHQTLCAPSFSGKSSCIILKSILERLKDPNFTTLIIAPTKIDCDLLKQKLLNLVEYSMLNINLSSIEIITPIQLLNKHLKKLKKNLLEDSVHVDTILMNKKFHIADLIICDDSNLASKEFILYLIHIQKNAGLLLVTQDDIFQSQQIFKKTFKSQEVISIFKQTNPYAKTLQIIKKLLENNHPNEILTVSSTQTTQNLHNDLSTFIDENITILKNSSNLIDYDSKNLTICSYNQISSIRYKFIILLDIKIASNEELLHLSNLANNTVYYLYDKECPEITILRNKIENKTK